MIHAPTSVLCTSCGGYRRCSLLASPELIVWCWALGQANPRTQRRMHEYWQSCCRYYLGGAVGCYSSATCESIMLGGR